MGRKRIEKITRMQNEGQRKVAILKKKQAVIKKLIELSVICDVRIFMLIDDHLAGRSTHYLSHKDFNIVDQFNSLSQREFYTNKDYEKVGGLEGEINSVYDENNEHVTSSLSSACQRFQKVEAGYRRSKIFSKKRRDLLRSARIGNYWK